MKKNEIEKIVNSIRKKRTATLERYKWNLNDWATNHDKVKASYFWTPGGNASSRRWEEKQKTFTESFDLGPLHLVYDSDCTCSCKNYYWHDSLIGTLNGEEIALNFGDVKKIVEGIENIISKRA